MIYEVKNADASISFVISSQRVWMPGSYATRQAANYAFRFSDGELSRIMRMANDRAGGIGGLITMDDLRAARKERKQ